MTSREFCYWLQGYFEIEGETPGDGYKLNPNQCKIIADHLKLVFYHEIDKSYGDKTHQEILKTIHSGEARLNC